MARSGETSTTDHQGDTAAHGDKTMRGGGRRNFKIPPVIDHRAGSFLADRLRLLLALFMPLHWRRFLLITLLVVTGVSAFVLGGGPHSIFMRANPTGQDTQPKKAEGPERTEVPAILEAEPNNAPDEPSLQAQLKTMEEELRYTERKLAAALGQLRDTDTGANTDQEGRRAALVLALGTGLPYQVHLQNLGPDWLGPEDMALLRRYGGGGSTMPVIWHAVSRPCWTVIRTAIRHHRKHPLKHCSRHWTGSPAMRALWLRYVHSHLPKSPTRNTIFLKRRWLGGLMPPCDWSMRCSSVRPTRHRLCERGAMTGTGAQWHPLWRVRATYASAATREPE